MVAKIPIAVAALVHDGRVLLGHRHPSRRWYPDCWDLVGGHVEPGEAPADAVRRECLEELGVTVHDPLPFPMTISDPTLEMHGFVVTRWDGEPHNTEPEEHDGLAWFLPGELPALRMAHPDVLPAVQLALRTAEQLPRRARRPGSTGS